MKNKALKNLNPKRVSSDYLETVSWKEKVNEIF
jgi:hypothetical protein